MMLDFLKNRFKKFTKSDSRREFSDSSIAEFWCTLSNIGFFMVGIYCFPLAPLTASFIFMAGTFSLLSHTTPSQLLHDFDMLGVVLIGIPILLHIPLILGSPLLWPLLIAGGIAVIVNVVDTIITKTWGTELLGPWPHVLWHISAAVALFMLCVVITGMPLTFAAINLPMLAVALGISVGFMAISIYLGQLLTKRYFLNTEPAAEAANDQHIQKEYEEVTKAAVVDLGLPKEERWHKALELFTDDDLKKCAAQYNEKIKDILGVFDFERLRQLPGGLQHRSTLAQHAFFNEEIRGEIAGMAEKLKERLGEEVPGFSFDDLILINYFGYDFNTACTTGMQQPEGDVAPIFFRTLDWDDPEDFKPFVFKAHFTRGEEDVFTAVQFLGQVVCLTAFKPGFFDIALNFRKTPGTGSSGLAELVGVVKALYATASGNKPCGLVIREIMQKERTAANDAVYGEAKKELEESALIAPAYFTIAGNKRNQGAVIERDRNGVHHTRTLQDDAPNGFLVQANHDERQNCLKELPPHYAGDDPLLRGPYGSKERRAAMERLLRAGRLIQVCLQQFPVENPLTILQATHQVTDSKEDIQAYMPRQSSSSRT